MIVRTLTGFILAPLLLVLLFCPPEVIAVCLAAVSMTAVYELLGHWVRPLKLHVKLGACVFSALLMALIVLEAEAYLYFGLVFLLVFLLFLEVFRDGESFDFFNLCGVFFAAAAIPALYSSLLMICRLEHYPYVIILPFVVTIVSDSFALFAGLLFGKHKLAPSISPKKTVEGAVGGYIFCILFQLLYAFVLQTAFAAQVNYLYFLIYGLVAGLVSQLGDLSMSAVKRSLGVKDFGRIFPGHGGILDRFDSLLFAAPAMWILLVTLPAVTV